jgi:hypothetical protein
MAAYDSGVQVLTLRSLALAWVLTLPCAIALSALLLLSRHERRTYSAASFSTGRVGGLKSDGSASKRTGSALSGERKGSRMSLKLTAIWGMSVLFGHNPSVTSLERQGRYE